MVMLHWKDAPAVTFKNPELTLDVGWGVHGAAKVDCVTVWFLAANWKLTTSPTAAVMLEGENFKPPWPTITVWVAAEARPTTERRVAAMVEKCIFESLERAIF